MHAGSGVIWGIPAKDALKSAPGYKYDKNSTTWVSDKS
jgi:hypothetical protein